MDWGGMYLAREEWKRLKDLLKAVNAGGKL
jgi:hypothetical protein